jgi:hypothetical protein
MKKLLVGILFCCPIICLGQISKGFEALKMYDFFKAKHIFTKSLKSNPAAANFGLALIHYDSLNHFHQLDSAITRIVKAEESYHLLTPKQIFKIRKFGVFDSSIADLKFRIYDAGFKRAKKLNVEIGWTTYLKNFSGSPFLIEAIKNRNEVSFNTAVAANSIAPLISFIEKYPDADQIVNAKDLLDDLQFNEVKKSNLLGDYENFILKYPSSKHVSDAEDVIYSISVTEPSIDQIYSFVKLFPKNRNTLNAWEILYELYTGDQRVESFTEFKEKFPEYPFQDKVYRDVALSKTRLFPAIENEKWGFVDSTGKVVIQYQYEEAGAFSENLAAVKLEGKFGFINKTGITVIKPQFEEADRFINGLSLVENNITEGLIDQRGNWIFKIDSASISGPVNNFYIVEKSEASFFLNRKGKRNNIEFEYLSEFHGYRAAFKKDGNVGYIDTLGNIIVPAIYEEGSDFENGFAQVKKNELCGLIDEEGKFIIPLKFDFIGNTEHTLIKVILNGKCAYYQKSGLNKIPFGNLCASSILGIDGFNGPLARIDKKSKKGFIDSNGKIVIPTIYDDAQYYSEGLIAVRKKKVWGFIQKNGKTAIDFQFDAVYPFFGGYSKVKRKGKWGIINKEGKLMLPANFDQLQDMNGCIVGHQNNLKGLISLNNKKVELLTEFVFDDIIKTEDAGIFQLLKNGKMALFHVEKKAIFWKEEGW